MDTEQEDFEDVLSQSEHLCSLECTDEGLNNFVDASCHSPPEHHTLFSETIWDHLAGDSPYGTITPESPYLIPGGGKSICSDVSLNEDESPGTSNPLLPEIDLYLECIDDPQYVMPEKPAINTHSLIGQNLQWKVSFPANHLEAAAKKAERFTCPDCARTFATENQRKQHLVVKHGKIVRFDCQQCGFLTDSNRNLNRHIRRKHKASISAVHKKQPGQLSGSPVQFTKAIRIPVEDNSREEIDTDISLCEVENVARPTRDPHASCVSVKPDLPNCISESAPQEGLVITGMSSDDGSAHDLDRNSLSEQTGSCTSTTYEVATVLSNTPVLVKEATILIPERPHFQHFQTLTDSTLLDTCNLTIPMDQSNNMEQFQPNLNNAGVQSSKESVSEISSNKNVVCMVKTHRDEREGNPSKREDIPYQYKCSECSFTCTTKPEASSHGHKMLIECCGCSKTFTSTTGLKKHQFRFHSDTTELPNLHECTYPMCEATFKLPCDLGDHTSSVHYSGKRLRCPHPDCKKTFKCRRSLRKHSCMHTDKWTCSWTGCGKGFRDQYNLQVHYFSHTGTKQNQCLYCDYTCIQKASMNWHVKKKHAMETDKTSPAMETDKTPPRTTSRTVHVEIHVL